MAKHVALLNKEDFSWSKKMTKKDRAECKWFIDKLCRGLDKKDEDILEMSEQIKKLEKNSREHYNLVKDDLAKKSSIIEKQTLENLKNRRYINKLKNQRDVFMILTIIISIAFVTMRFLTK